MASKETIKQSQVDHQNRRQRQPEKQGIEGATQAAGLVPASQKLNLNRQALSPGEILRLQRAVGNRVAGSMVAAAAKSNNAVSRRIQRVPRESQAQIEERQPWSEYQIPAPLGPVDETIAAAVMANAQLGFSASKISRLLVSLGLPRRPTVMERRFVEALRAFQASHAAAAPSSETARTSEAETAAAPAGQPARTGEAEAITQPGAGASGILDEDTIFALDTGTNWGLEEHGAGARRFYRGQAPWRNMPQEQFEAIRSAIAGPLRVSEDELQLEEGRVAASDHFLSQVINWQMWHRRSEEQSAWGKLSLPMLSEIGAPVAAPAPAQAPSTETEAAESAAAEALAEAAPGEEIPAESEEEARDEQGLTAPQRAQLEGYVADIDAYLEDWYQRVRGEATETRDTRRAGLDAQMEPELASMRRSIEAMGPYTDFGRVFQYQRVRVRAENVRTEIRILLGLETRQAEVTAEQAAEPSPLERRGLPESVTSLTERGYVVEQQALRREGWDPRVWRGEGTVQEAAQAAVAGLEQLRGRMEDLRDMVQAGIDQPATHLAPALLEICVTDLSAPQTLRRQWQPTLPRRTNPADMADWSEQRQLQYAVSWRNGLRQALTVLDTEIRRNQGYDRPAMAVENRMAVLVDLHRSGITVTNNNGRPLRTDEMHLDPIFADAMVRFLEELGGLGVTEMWTAGFLREAISSADTHPRGQACDITGFQVGGQLLHLRSGRPQAPPGEEGDENYEDRRRGHSDWFDHTGMVGGMTHERVLHAITNIMRTYFSRIVGPGHNQEHQGHWHIELTQGTSRGPQVLAVARDVDQPSFVTERADLREEGWRTPGEE